jgi:arsenate reductase-like glutaredoxin family protein
VLTDRLEDIMAAAPTNAEIVRMLQQLSKELAAIKRTQDELLRKVGR